MCVCVFIVVTSVLYPLIVPPTAALSILRLSCQCGGLSLSIRKPLSFPSVQTALALAAHCLSHALSVVLKPSPFFFCCPVSLDFTRTLSRYFPVLLFAAHRCPAFLCSLSVSPFSRLPLSSPPPRLPFLALVFQTGLVSMSVLINKYVQGCGLKV